MLETLKNGFDAQRSRDTVYMVGEGIGDTGQMPKKDPVLAALGECPENWNPFLLKNYGLPQEPATRKEIQQDCLPRAENGRRLTLGEVGESTTQLTDELLSIHQEAAANENIKLSPE